MPKVTTPFNIAKLAASVYNVVKSLRVGEAIMMSGFFIIGSLFANPVFLSEPLKTLKIFSGVLLYIMTVYSLNSFTGYDYDQTNPRLQDISKVKKRQFGILTIIYLLLCLVMFYSIKPILLIYALCAFALWCMYYVPFVKLKAVLFGGTGIHLLAQIFHFHLGYAAFADSNIHSIAIAFYFSLLLAAGHFHHELIDYEADKANNIKTTAVRLGFELTVKLMEIFFLLSVLYWTTLYFFKVIDLVSFASFIAASILIVVFYRIWVLPIKSLSFRTFYRLIFFGAGMVLIALKHIGG